MNAWPRRFSSSAIWHPKGATAVVGDAVKTWSVSQPMHSAYWVVESDDGSILNFASLAGAHAELKKIVIAWIDHMEYELQ